MTALPSGTRLGSYQVVALIGAGGMGEVEAPCGREASFCEAGSPQPKSRVRLGGRVLFQTRTTGLEPNVAFSQQYDVTRDGQRFLINTDVSDVTATPITVVLDWTAALQK